MTSPERPAEKPIEGRGADLLLTIRGLAALAVVVWHVVGYAGTFNPIVNVPGRVAVWIFFGISGYVIGYGFVRGRYELTSRDLGSFYVNRLLRIYPLFLVVSLVELATARWRTGQSPITVADIPSQFLALQFNHEYRLSGVFWTLGIEIQFYLLAPLLALLFMEKRRRPILTAACLYAALILWNFYASLRLGWSWDGRNIISHLPHFLAGMAACYVVNTWRGWRPTTLVALSGAALLLATTNVLYHRAPRFFWTGGGVLVDGVIVLCVFAHAQVESNRHVAQSTWYRVLAWGGILSYGMYAWHPYFMKYSGDWATNLFAIVVLSLGAAYLTYRVVERPALRLKRHMSERVAKPAAAALPVMGTQSLKSGA